MVVKYLFMLGQFKFISYLYKSLRNCRLITLIHGNCSGDLVYKIFQESSGYGLGNDVHPPFQIN